MPFYVNCPHCDSRYRLKDHKKGCRVECKGCRNVFRAGPKSAKTAKQKNVASPPTPTQVKQPLAPGQPLPASHAPVVQPIPQAPVVQPWVAPQPTATPAPNFPQQPYPTSAPIAPSPIAPLAPAPVAPPPVQTYAPPIPTSYGTPAPRQKPKRAKKTRRERLASSYEEQQQPEPSGRWVPRSLQIAIGLIMLTVGGLLSLVLTAGMGQGGYVVFVGLIVSGIFNIIEGLLGSD